MAGELGDLFSQFEDAPEVLPSLDLEEASVSPEQQNQNMENYQAPIPGQSLTASKGEMPHERPPQYTTEEEAMDFLFTQFTIPEKYVVSMRMIDAKLPIAMIAEQVVLSGAASGKWNMDLSMLLMEPLIMMLASLAVNAGIDPVIQEPKKKVDYDPRGLAKALGTDKKKNEQVTEVPEIEKKEIKNLLGFTPKEGA